MTSIKKHIAAALTADIFAPTLTVPVTATESSSIRVSSYKGSTLSVGERNNLMIGSSGTESSNNPAD